MSTANYFAVRGGQGAPSSTPGSGTGTTPPSGTGKVESSMSKHRTLWLAGAGVGVVGLALFMSSRDQAAGPDEEQTDFELDTRDTDVYNELQPELEEVADRLDELEHVGPRPGHTKPPKPGPKPKHRPRRKHGPKGKAPRRPKPNSAADRREDRRDRREDRRDRRTDRSPKAERREDRRDRREDRAERREDRPKRHSRSVRDKLPPHTPAIPRDRLPGRPSHESEPEPDRQKGRGGLGDPMLRKLRGAASRNAKPKARRA